jgi:hypothetical protein
MGIHISEIVFTDTDAFGILILPLDFQPGFGRRNLYFRGVSEYKKPSFNIENLKSKNKNGSSVNFINECDLIIYPIPAPLPKRANSGSRY